MKFRDWKEELDRHVESVVGFTSDDLPDKDYMCMFEDGISPLEAAIEVLEDEGLNPLVLKAKLENS